MKIFYQARGSRFGISPSLVDYSVILFDKRLCFMYKTVHYLLYICYMLYAVCYMLYARCCTCYIMFQVGSTAALKWLIVVVVFNLLLQQTSGTFAMTESIKSFFISRRTPPMKIKTMIQLAMQGVILVLPIGRQKFPPYFKGYLNLFRDI